MVTLILDFGGGGCFEVVVDGGAAVGFWVIMVFFLGCWGEGDGGVDVGVDWNLAQSLATLSASLFPSRLSRLVPS